MLLKLFRQICLVKSSETFPGLIWLSLNAPWDPGDRRVVVPPPVAGCLIWAQLPIFSSLHFSTLCVLVIQSRFDHYNLLRTMWISFLRIDRSQLPVKWPAV